MRKYIALTLTVIGYMIITPAFQCGNSPISECNEYIRDTAYLNYSVQGNLNNVHVLDTIRFNSYVSDSVRSARGKNLIYEFTTLESNLQAYKVVDYGSGKALNYANIEFNAAVSIGIIQNVAYLGVNALYNRVAPYNELKGYLAAGRPGLYLVTVEMARYGSSYNFSEPNNYCVSYAGIAGIPLAQQQRQYWDSLNTTSLRLASNNNFIVASKEQKNYFFVNVLP